MSRGRALGILGAGASGLSLALLTHLDHLLIEAAGHAGGHAGSTSIDGWTFDQGPHIMFSRDQLLLDCMVASLGSNVHQSRRNNRVAVAGALARYPIENDLAALPHPLRANALIDLMQARQQQDPAPENLAQWFTANFGPTLVDEYFRPYNEKLWKVPLEELSMSWSERIPQPPWEDVVRGAVGELSEGYLHQLYYSYPQQGGYAALLDAWASGIHEERLAVGQEVSEILPAKDSVTVRTSSAEWAFEQVVSTLPLSRLVTLVPGVPAEVQDSVARLVVNPIIATTLGFRGEDPNQFTAVYIPDPDYLVNRVSYPAVFSPQNAPDGCFSVQAEITCRPGAEVMSWPDGRIREHVLEGLRSRRLVPGDAELVFDCVQRFDEGYVVYPRGYEEDVRRATDWFASKSIILHGRFGSHNYLNVDGCLRLSLDLARQLGAEITDQQVLERFSSLGRPN